MTRVNSTGKEASSNFSPDNGTGLQVRTAIKDVFESLRTLNSASGDPSGNANLAAYQVHIDSDNDTLKIRNGNNDGFVILGNVSQTNFGLLAKTGGTLTGVLGLPNGTNSAPSIHLGDTTTGLFRKGSNQIGLTFSGSERAFFDQNGLTLLAQKDVRFSDSDSTHYVALQSPATISTSFTLTLPSTAGSNGQFLKVDGSGNLSFATVDSTVTIGSTAVTTGGSAATTISGLTTVDSTNVNSTTTKATTVQTNATTRVAPEIENSNGAEIARFCKAYVNFNGQGTVAKRDDFNVTGVTDNGTGTYNINFGTAMADANYTVVLSHDFRSVNNRGIGLDSNNYSTTTFRVTTEDATQQYGSGSSRVDCKIIGVAVFGNT